jgi:hypothetical protein
MNLVSPSREAAGHHRLKGQPHKVLARRAVQYIQSLFLGQNRRKKEV